MDPERPQPRSGDAFGQILTRCWEAGGHPGVAFEIVERDDGFISADDAARYFKAADAWPAVEQWGYGLAVGRILDVGCGAGRHLVPLGEAGHDVVGVDPSAGAARIVRARGGRVIRGTIEDVPARSGLFDTILLFGNNLGLLGSDEAAIRFLHRLATLAGPGARLLGSGTDPYRTAAAEHLAYHERNRRHGRLPGHLRLRVRDREVATEWFDYVFRSPDEFRDTVATTPWVMVDLRREGANYCVRLELRG
jgi:SAM-dependent methyltransferase